MSATSQVARWYAATAGAASAARMAPALGGLLLASAIVFGPTGVHPRDALAAMDASPAARAAVWSAWVGLTAAPTRALFDTPSSFPLRWLPVSRLAHAALVGAWLFALDVPWFVFWAVGRGPLAAASATLVAAALQVAVVARPRAVHHLALAAALVGGVAGGAPSGPLALVAVVALAVLGARAWGDAPARDAPVPWMRASGSPFGALCRAWVASLARGERSALLRGAALAVAAGLGAGLAALHAGDLAEPSAADADRVTLLVAVVVAAVAASGVVGPLVDLELRTTWLLDATATTPATRALARAAVPSGMGAIFGVACAGASAVVASSSPLASLARAGAVGVAASAVAAAVAATARGATRAAQRGGHAVDAARATIELAAPRCDRVSLLLRALAVGAAAAALVSAFDVRAVSVLVLLAAAWVALDVRAARDARRP